MYHKGWTAVTRHSVPWDFGAALPALDDDVWELYDTNTDWTQAHDLAQEQPEKLAELQRVFLIEAVKYGVLPLDDRRVERFNSDLAGRPVLVKGNDQILYGGMHRLSENSVINLKNKSHSVTAEIEVPKGGANGVIIAQGGAFAGWSLYLQDGKPKYCHNLAGLMRFYVEGTRKVPAGTHQVRMEFAYDGGGLAKGGLATLFIDGKKAGEGRINATVPMIYSGDETCDVGRDTGTPVSEDYTAAVECVHRNRALGRAARRRRQPRPPHLTRRADEGRDLDPVGDRGRAVDYSSPGSGTSLMSISSISMASGTPSPSISIAVARVMVIASAVPSPSTSIATVSVISTMSGMPSPSTSISTVSVTTTMSA